MEYWTKIARKTKEERTPLEELIYEWGDVETAAELEMYLQNIAMYQENMKNMREDMEKMHREITRMHIAELRGVPFTEPLDRRPDTPKSVYMEPES